VSRHSRYRAKAPPTANTELQEPIPALVKRNGYEGHVSSLQPWWPQKRGIDLNNPYTEPEAPRTGRRRPHVPSSKTNNVKDPTNNMKRTTIVPRNFLPGDYVVQLSWRPMKASRWSVVPVGEGRIWAGTWVGQRLFAILFQFVGGDPEKSL